jgi:hypothetical protein
MSRKGVAMIDEDEPQAAADPLSDDRSVSRVGASVAGAFAAAVESGRLNLPLPGGGRTCERWAILTDLAEEDLSLARLSEGHTDALAILAELGATPRLTGAAGASGPRSLPALA